ncbi:GTPase [Streptomyces sp. NBC_01565]|uniref:GTPase n=1 Tax=unclassified Streptomyces TaxID=2593676 RepID=UPI0022549301|nr:GTPase [Streptomyces sp. NBC_01565]MCX4546348.1 50S ribosome-binding GTPase [Streptomyces sp. NBC_01565]
MSESWFDDVQQAVATIHSEQMRQTAEEDWQAHARRASVVVAVHGPYDAGKSTLIKRLLVEDGTAVPQWLTVSGRKETTAASAADSLGITYVDTPGTAGGITEHDRQAADATTRTDALLLVITPQLLADDARWIRAFSTGTFYSTGPRTLFHPGALLLVIAQSDTAGVDPLDSPGGFRALCDRKRAELDRMLDLGDADVRPRVHMVSADPYAQVGADPQPSRSDYADAADWDGLADLRADLAALGGRLDALRAAGRIRYWSLLGKRAAEAAAREIAELEPVLEEARSRQARRALLLSKLETLVEAASVQLGLGIDGALHGIADLHGMSEAGLQAEARQRLTEYLESWYSTWDRKLKELATEADAEIDIERVRPAAKQFDTWIRDVADHTASPEGSPSLTKLTTGASSAVKAGFWMTHRMTLQKAKEELRKAADAGSVETYLASADAAFKTKQRLESARTWLPRAEFLAEFASVAAGLTPLLQETLDKKLAAEQERKHNQELQSRIDAISAELREQVLDDPVTGWKRAAEKVRERIEVDPWLQPVVATAKERVEELRRALSLLLELLSALPALPAQHESGETG